MITLDVKNTNTWTVVQAEGYTTTPTSITDTGYDVGYGNRCFFYEITPGTEKTFIINYHRSTATLYFGLYRYNSSTSYNLAQINERTVSDAGGTVTSGVHTIIIVTHSDKTVDFYYDGLKVITRELFGTNPYQAMAINYNPGSTQIVTDVKVLDYCLSENEIKSNCIIKTSNMANGQSNLPTYPYNYIDKEYLEGKCIVKTRYMENDQYIADGPVFSNLNISKRTPKVGDTSTNDEWENITYTHELTGTKPTSSDGKIINNGREGAEGMLWLEKIPIGSVLRIKTSNPGRYYQQLKLLLSDSYDSFGAVMGKILVQDGIIRYEDIANTRLTIYFEENISNNAQTWEIKTYTTGETTVKRGSETWSFQLEHLHTGCYCVLNDCDIDSIEWDWISDEIPETIVDGND
ncbi:MAG: hypothetical protein J6V44_03595 [Methanobrevibacter sp.]|nr:hypothetical protein [Methanobrevibacter sp.]